MKLECLFSLRSSAYKYYCTIMCLYQVVIENNVCVCQVRDGRTGSVLFQSEEKSSRIRCTCMCRQPSAVALGQEDGTVQVVNTFRPTVHAVCFCVYVTQQSNGFT